MMHFTHSVIKFVAQYFIVLSLAAALAVLIRARQKDQRIDFCLLLAGAGLLSLALAKLGSQLVHDPRPFAVGHFTPLIAHTSDNGFPSDHTLLSSLIGWTCLVYSRKIGSAALVVAALIGVARMAAGVHHLEDIVGSFVISGLSVLAVCKLIRLWRRRAV